MITNILYLYLLYKYKREKFMIFASDDLRNNRDVVLAAVNQNGAPLQFASGYVGNADFALAAVRVDVRLDLAGDVSNSD